MIITKTIKFNKKAVGLIIADVVFLLLILGTFFIAGIIEEKTSGQLEKVSYYGEKIDEFIASGKGLEETDVIADELEEGTETIKSFFFTLLIGLIVILVLLIAGSTFVKGYIYSRFFNINYKKFLKRFALINISWQIAWIGIFTLTLFLVEQVLIPYFLLAEIILYLILTPIARSCSKNNFFKNFGSCMKRLYLFIIPVALMVLAGFAVFMFVGATGFIHPGFMLISSILFVVLLSWSRYYIYLVVKKCVKHR
ncbi:MAG: hypothetical protein ACOCZ6_01525 [Nanoarchaeota archaeon]